MNKMRIFSRFFFIISMQLLLAAGTLYGQLSGSYTINPAGTGDFATIQDAVDELAANGVSGEVFIRLADGNYGISEIDIPAIPDIREEFRVYFESESGDPQSLHLRGEGQYVFRFDDAFFITFRNLQISNDDGHIFFFEGDGNGIHLQNNVITGRENAANNAAFNLIHSASGISYPGTLIEDSELTGGNWGIRLNAASGEPSQGLSIANNVIQTQRGMDIRNFVAPEISANRVLANANFALYFTSNIFDFDDPALIINNLFVSENQQSANIVTGRNIRFYHNTVVTRGAAGNGALRITQNNQQVYVRNNLVTAMGGGRAFVQTTGGANLLGAVQESDHNAFYSPDSHRFTVGTIPLRNLEQWVDLTDQDRNSRFIYPAFPDDDSFETNSFFLDTAGDDVLSIVDEDINGNARSSTPGIGAYEYSSTLTPLSAGNYSVGGAGNYPDMQSAADDLALRGIDGPVTLSLAPGTYTDRAVFFPVPNASAANRVTTSSLNGNPDDVTILLEDGNDIILDLVSPKYFDIRGLTFNTEQVTGSNTRHGILIRGGFRDVSVSDNRFDAEVISNTTFTLSSLASESASGIALEIRHNEFTGAGYGINLSGMSSGFRSELVRIEQNRLTDSRRGIRVHHATAPHILSNRVLNAGNDGIKLNSVRANDDDDEDRPLVANNVVTGQFGGGPVRILLSFDVRFYHNTVLLTGGTETARVLELGSSAGRHDIRNNIFASDSQAPLVQDNSNNTLLDYNNYYSPSPFINRRIVTAFPSSPNTHYRTLEEVQDVRDYDFNSFYRYVRFTDDQELTIDAPWLDDAGADLSQWVTQDINGNARTSSPSIGAHQYSSTLTPVPAGSYTIGSGGDWPDLATAIDELERAGVDLDGERIILEFLPGTYEIEQRIRTIPGTSSESRITITSSTGNADDVLIRGIPGTAEYVLLLDGTENINIHNLTFTFEEGEDADRSLIALQYGTGEVEMSGNVFLGGAREGFDPVRSAVSGTGIYRDHLTISENIFNGSGFATDINTHHMNNPFTTGVVLRNNEVTAGEWGFRLRSFLAPQIVNNIINVQRSAFELYNINSDPDDGLIGLIANNVTRSETNRSMLLQNSNRLRIYHNTFDQVRNTANDAIVHISGGMDHELLNNLFRLERAGRILLTNGFQRIDRSDHNNFEFDQSQLVDFARVSATSYNTLQEYEDASGQEVNSTETGVQFVSEETLIPVEGQNELLGTPETLTLVPDDLAGITRGDPPFKGAYEPVEPQDNQPPFFTATIDDETMVEGEEFSFQFEAEDPDGDALTFSLTQGNDVENASITAAGLFTFNPDFGQAGAYDFTVRVSDGELFDEHDFVVIVEAPNQPPVFTVTFDDETVDEGEELSFQFEAEDPDGDALTFSLTQGNDVENAGITQAGLFTFNPDFGQAGAYDFTVRVSDGELFDEHDFSVTVIAVNRPPVFVSEPITIVQINEQYSYLVEAEDPDGDAITLTAEILPSWLTFTDSGDGTGILEGTPTEADTGDHDVELTASDGELTASQAFSINVRTEPNQPPFFTETIDEAAIAEGDEFSFQFEAEDPDGDDLTFSLIQGNDVENAGITAAGLFTFNPDFGQAGEYDFTVRVSDGGLFDVHDFTISVDETNRPPVFTATIDEETVAEGEEFTFQFEAEDPDGDDLTFSLIQGNDVENAGITQAGLFTFNPDFGQAGEYDFTVRVSDGGLFVEHNFVITVVETNRPPEVVNPFPDIVLQEGGDVYQADPDTVFTDPDGDALTYTAESSDESIAAVTVDELLTVEPVGPGTAVITVTADDGRGGSVSDQFEVMVEPEEAIDPPIAEDIEEVTWMNLSVVIDVTESVSHPEDRPVSVSDTETPATSGGSVEIVDDLLIRYTPPDDFTGSDHFIYTVRDDLNQEASAEITVEVNAILFELTDLGDLGGGASAATAMNDHGEVAGVSLNSSDQIRPFFWNGEEMEEPQIAAEGDVQAYAINSSGMLAGFAGVGATEGSAFRYHDGETDLAPSVSGSYSAAYAINNNGNIAGVMESGSEYRGFAWNEELIAISVPQGVLSIIYALADNNVPAGLVQDANGVTRGFRNNETGPAGSRIYAMNRSGLAVGSSNNSPLVWPPDEDPEVLGVTGEFYSANESGWIAGLVAGDQLAKSRTGFGLRFKERNPHTDLRRPLARSLDGNSTAAALRVGGTLFTLGDLVTNAEGWQLIEAASVNEAGQIAGTARVNGQIRAFLLTPIENDGQQDKLADHFEVPGDDAVYLFQNYPNPFNPSTMIRFFLAEPEMVSLAVYDLLGRRVAGLIEGRIEKGAHSIEFDGSQLSSGVYIYRLQTGSGVRVRQLTLLK